MTHFMKSLCGNLCKPQLTRTTVTAVESDLVHGVSNNTILKRWCISKSTLRKISKGKHRYSTKEL